MGEYFNPFYMPDCHAAEMDDFAQEVATFRYDPYNAVHGKVAVGFTYPYAPQRVPVPPTFASVAVAPEGTLHKALDGKVTFVPYPYGEFYVEPPRMPKAAMDRVFVGQLPYGVTDMQLNWLCMTFGGTPVYFPERIMKRETANPDARSGRVGKVPTGCIHAYCDPAQAENMMSWMHKRLLVDDTGVWYAQDQAESVALNTYCGKLKADRRKRVANRPYDTVVVQFAMSTYVPPPTPPVYPF